MPETPSLSNLSRGLLLDRDGVINIDHNYVGSRERFEFLPGLFPFLRAARDRGYRLCILTNQAGVARGLFTEADYHDLTRFMTDKLAAEGVSPDLILVSFTHPSAAKLREHARDSFWRKPNPGMALETVQRLRLDPARSAFLGDSLTDMQAALAAGIGQPLWLRGANPPPGVTAVADYEAALARL